MVADMNYAALQETKQRLWKAQSMIVELRKEVEGLKQQLSVQRSLTLSVERELFALKGMK